MPVSINAELKSITKQLVPVPTTLNAVQQNGFQKNWHFAVLPQRTRPKLFDLAATCDVPALSIEMEITKKSFYGKYQFIRLLFDVDFRINGNWKILARN